MGAVQADYGNAIRNMARPDLDMDDPKAMGAYGQWLINNGKTEEGQQMMAQSAELKRQNRIREGESAIVGLLARLNPNTSQAEREKIITAVGRIAEATGASPAAYQQLMNEQNLQRRGVIATEEDTASKIRDRGEKNRLRAQELGLTKQQLDQQQERFLMDFKRGIFENNRDFAEGQRRDNRNFAEDVTRDRRDFNRTVVTTDREFAEGQYQYRDTAKRADRQFDLRYSLDVDQFNETKRMNDHSIKVDDTQLEQGWANLSLQERRVVVAEQLKDNEISFTEFRKLIMGDENDRLNEMQPYEIEAKKAGIKVALASVGNTEAQTERIMYDLGFDKETEGYRKDILESEADLADINVGLGKARTGLVKAQTKGVKQDIARSKADVDRIIAETEVAHNRADYVEEQTANLVAARNLNREQWEYTKVRNEYLDGINEQMLNFERRVQEAGLNLTQANIDNIYSLITSRTFSDNMAAAQILGQGITEARTAAFALTFDPLNETATNRARIGFLNQYGAGAAVDFNDALKEKLDIAKLRADAQRLALGNEDATPATRKQLEAANFSDEAIDVIFNTTDSRARNQIIVKEATRMLSPDRGATVTSKHLETMKPRAEALFYGTFGEDWFGPFPVGNDVSNDKEAITAINWAMSQANAAGKPPSEIVMAGVVAMQPWLNEVGGGAIENLDNLMREAGLE
jgi:hypothetical protein